jgi:hypothetical protein
MRFAIVIAAIFLSACASNPHVLYKDSFQSDAGQWITELEGGGSVRIGNGEMDIDVPAGATVWFRPILHSPVLIEYDATSIRAGGANDRVSDLNCFWMARDARSLDDFFVTHRTGKFADYNQLLCYYASIGGNSNTTTRFRRYIGSPTTRPILPEHDLRDSADMLAPNQTMHIQLIANGRHVEFRRDDRTVFSFDDPDPYTTGYFAIRTTQNHLRVRNFKVSRLNRSHQ